MLKQAIHPKIVSERLGHSSIGITLDTYSHVIPGLREAAALRFEESLRQAAEQSVEEMLANGWQFCLMPVDITTSSCVN
jgi:hypothetical protein